MPVVIGTLLAVLVIGVVLYPFLKPRLRSGDRPTPDFQPMVGAEAPAEPGVPETIHEHIKGLRQDYELGMMEEAEYQERLRGYRLQAAAALRDQEALRLGLDRAHEEQILAARTSADGEGAALCPGCGQPLASANVECSSCGATIAPDDRRQRKSGG